MVECLKNVSRVGGQGDSRWKRGRSHGARDAMALKSRLDSR